jgi:hypothetical protein
MLSWILTKYLLQESSPGKLKAPMRMINMEYLLKYKYIVYNYSIYVYKLYQQSDQTFIFKGMGGMFL